MLCGKVKERIGEGGGAVEGWVNIDWDRKRHFSEDLKEMRELIQVTILEAHPRQREEQTQRL